jgi:RNA polymerase sigma-70 factor (ECF subfamily)
LRIEGGLGLHEICEITGAVRDTVNSRLRYALARIRARFQA